MPATTFRAPAQPVRSVPAHHQPEGVRATLLRCERRYKVRWAVLTILGFGFLWIGPAFFATLTIMLQIQANGIPSPWWELFFWGAVVGIPLLFVLEWRTRGGFADDAIDSVGGADAASWSVGHRAGASLALITEVSLWGPRIIINGVRRLVSAGKFAGDVAAPAAILSVLLRSDEGIATSHVLSQSGLDAEAFGDALAYLTFHDFIGISKDGRQLWICTEARKCLG
jgi:hypothetical protein